MATRKPRSKTTVDVAALQQTAATDTQTEQTATQTTENTDMDDTKKEEPVDTTPVVSDQPQTSVTEAPVEVPVAQSADIAQSDTGTTQEPVADTQLGGEATDALPEPATNVVAVQNVDAASSVNEAVEAAAEQTQQSTTQETVDEQPQAAEQVQQSQPVEQVMDMANLSAATIVGDGVAEVAQAPVVADAPSTGENLNAAAYNAYEKYWMNEYKILGYSETFTKKAIELLSGDVALSHVSKAAVLATLDYAYSMGPNSCSSEEAGMRKQSEYFNSFTLFLNVGCDDFRKGMTFLLATVNESIKNNTGFSGILPFRFAESMRGSKEYRDAVVAIMHLLTTTADSAKRSLTVKQVDVPKCVAFGVSEMGKQRLLEFYSN